jgi:hypothetical protein
MTPSRFFSATTFGATLALGSASASAQTNTPVGATVGTSAVIGAPGAVYGATVAPSLGGASVAAPGFGYGTTGTQLGIGYVSIPSTITIGSNNVVGLGATTSPPATPWLSPAYAGVSGTGGAFGSGALPGTTTTNPPLGFGVPGTTSGTIDGYGSGLTTSGYASPPGTTSLAPGVIFLAPAGSTLGGSAYMNEMFGVPGLIP